MKNIRRHTKQLIAEDIKAVTEKFGGEVVSLHEVGRENISLKRENITNRRGVYTAFYAEEVNATIDSDVSYVIICEQRKRVEWHVMRFVGGMKPCVTAREFYHKEAFGAFCDLICRWGNGNNRDIKDTYGIWLREQAQQNAVELLAA